MAPIRHLVLVAAGALFMGSPAVAAPPPSSSALRERAHTIDLELHAHGAELAVERSVFNAGDGPAEAELRVRGWGWVAHGLQSRLDDGTWIRGDLMDFSEAQQTYEELTGVRHEMRTFARDPALLLWGPRGYDLFVYPVNPGLEKRVRYRLEAPYSWRDGSFQVPLPEIGPGELGAEIRVASVPRGHRLFAGDRELRTGDRLNSESLSGGLRLQPRKTAPLHAELAVVKVLGQSFVQVGARTSAKLGPEPDRSHVVVVIDRSRSMMAGSHDAARQAATDYLAALETVPGARARVLTFGRSATPVGDGFMRPAAAAADLALQPEVLENGSNVADALRAAYAMLRAAPSDAPRRILLLSDTRVPESVLAEIEAQSSTAETVVHVADVTQSTSTGLKAVHKHALFDWATGTGGMTWRATVDPRRQEHSELFAAWVRPQAIRGLAWHKDGEPAPEIGLATIDAGEEWREEAFMVEAPRDLTVEGWVWGRRVHATAGRTRSGDRSWERLAMPRLVGLGTENQVRALSMRTGVVSPETALLAVERGATPGSIAYDNADWYRRAPRVWRTDCRIGWPVYFGPYRLEFDPEAFLHDVVETARRECNAEWRHASVEFQTSYGEILSVRVASLETLDTGDESANAADQVRAERVRSCMEGALWAVEFPPGDDAIETVTVALPGA